MTLVSVITPTYNREDTISRAIESVLDQTYDEWEYLIVDDASTDDTKEVVGSYNDSRIRYLRHETNQRQAAARNTALEAAEGQYVAFLDSDDEWHPVKLEKQVKWLENHGDDWVGVYCDGDTQRTSLIKNFLSHIFPYDIKKEGSQELIQEILTMQGNISAGSSLIVRTEAAKAINGFDELLLRHEDLDFTLRLLCTGKLGYIDEKLFIVYESGDPSAEMMAESKRQYLEKHSDTVSQLEAEGYPVRDYHNFHLARCYFSDGRFREGFQYLHEAKASNPRQYLRFLASIFQGIKAIVEW